MGGIELLPTVLEIESVADALPIIRKEIPATKEKTGGRTLCNRSRG